MASITFFLKDEELIEFKRQVGEGNMSGTLRNYVKSYGEGSSDFKEKRLRKEFEVATENYQKMKAIYERLKAKVEAINAKQKQEEIANIKKKEKEFKKFQDIRHEYMGEEMRRALLKK